MGMDRRNNQPRAHRSWSVLTAQVERNKLPNKSRHATPISRPVYMTLSTFNLNPVIDARPR
jgi:hypothetical protein